MEYRIRQTLEIDKLSEKAAADKIRKEDKVRSVYYNFYTGHDWGKPSDYNYCINTAENREAEPQLYTVEHNLTSNDVIEQVIKGNIALIKHTDDVEIHIEIPEEGAEFEVYLKSAGRYANAVPDERDGIVCDEKGFGQTYRHRTGIGKKIATLFR